MRSLIFTAVLVLAAPAVAQEAEEEKITEIDFEDDTISGDLQRPDGELIEARRRVQHTNLIRERESFRNRILESVGDL